MLVVPMTLRHPKCIPSKPAKSAESAESAAITVLALKPHFPWKTEISAYLQANTGNVIHWFLVLKERSPSVALTKQRY